MIHDSSVVDPGAEIGVGTKVWHFCHISASANVGSGCTLGQNVYVGERVVIGNRVKIQNNVSVYEGVMLEDDVFCGPSVVFANVSYPRSAVSQRAHFAKTRVGRGATLGANATILPGIDLGEFCLVAAGAVVTRDVPAFGLVRGVPAEAAGWVSRLGKNLDFSNGYNARCSGSGERYVLRDGRVSLGGHEG